MENKEKIKENILLAIYTTLLLGFFVYVGFLLRINKNNITDLQTKIDVLTDRFAFEITRVEKKTKYKTEEIIVYDGPQFWMTIEGEDLDNSEVIKLILDELDMKIKTETHYKETKLVPR